MDLMTLIAALKVDDSEFNKGIRKAERNGKKFSDKFEKFTGKARKLLVGAFSAVAVKKAIDGVLGFANSISSLGDQIDKQSQVLGMSRQRYQEWDYILSQTGGNIESMSVSMKTLNNAILEGSKESADAFKTIGLSAKDLAGMSVEDQFEAVVRAFQKLPAGAEKSAAAVKLFGKNGMELLPLLNADVLEIDILRQKAKDLGLIMSDEAVDASVEYQDSLDTMKRTFQGLRNTIGSKVLPVLTNAFDRMSQYASKLRKAYDNNGLRGVFETLKEDAGKVWASLKDNLKNSDSSALRTFGNALQTIEDIFNWILENQELVITAVGAIAAAFAVSAIADFVTNLSPLKIAFIGIAAVAAVIASNWETISTWVVQAGDSIKEWAGKTWDTIVNFASTTWESVVGWFTDLGTWVANAWDTTVNFIRGTWDNVKNAIADVSTKVWNSTVNFALGLVDAVKEFIQFVSQPITVLVNFIKGNTKGLFGYDPEKGETWSQAVMNDSRFPKVDLSKYDPSYFDDEHAKGLLNVPFDGYIAKLHRNERILTASQARHQDDGSIDSGLLANMIQMLGNKIGNMSIMVGRDEFGRTVVNNSGRRMKGYMGRMNRREAKAYGR